MKRIVILVTIITALASINAFASDTLNPIVTETDYEPDVYYVTVDIEPVEIEVIEDYSLRKGYEVIHLLQTISQPISIIVFILSAFLMLIGSVGRVDWAGRGFIGMLTACVCYALILYAPVILQTFAGWLVS